MQRASWWWCRSFLWSSALLLVAGCDDGAAPLPDVGDPVPVVGPAAGDPHAATTPLVPLEVEPHVVADTPMADAPVEDDLGDETARDGDDDVEPEPDVDPEPEPEVEPEPEIDWCVEGPNKTGSPDSHVFYGTALPQHVPLTPGQIMAVGTFGSCSGALVADRWVLSAAHCSLWVGDWFCMGEAASNPNKCLQLEKVYDHPTADMAIARLTHDAQLVLPEVEPITLNTFALDYSWIGKIAEAAGYGQQETGYSGEREFTAEPIVALYQSAITIDGQGKHGVCFGDSGGPLMIIADDGSVRVAGALSEGSGSCVGQDHFTRVDTYLDWIESLMGPIQTPGPQPCGDVDAKGSCDADGVWAKWCAPDGTLSVDKCEGASTCSWDVDVEGWRCVPVAEDPCAGLTSWGACDGNLLSWCGESGLLERDCGACDETCVPNDELGWICVASTCGDLTWFGACDGDVVTWCNRDGEPESFDCGQLGQTCTWVNAETGHYCGDKGCGDVDYFGRCKGTVVEWCEDGKLETVDCANQGLACGWIDDQTGFYCGQ